MHSLGEGVPSPLHGVLLACSPLHMLGPPQLTTDPSLSCNHSTSTGLALISPEILFSNHGPAFPNNYSHLQNWPPKWLWAPSSHHGPAPAHSQFGTLSVNAKSEQHFISACPLQRAHFFRKCTRAKILDSNYAWAQTFSISSPLGPHLPLCLSMIWGVRSACEGTTMLIVYDRIVHKMNLDGHRGEPNMHWTSFVITSLC